MQSLRGKARIQPGHKVLVNGAAEGVGRFAVRTATCFGATVTGVCRTANVEPVRSLGADRVVDYPDRMASEAVVATPSSIALAIPRFRDGRGS